MSARFQTPADPVFLAIDCGTSVVKAAAFDPAGAELGDAEASLATLSPHPGWMEYDPETLWTTACAALRNLLMAVPNLAPRIAAIGVTGAGNGAALIGPGGKPTRNGILALDNRAAAEPRTPAFAEAARAIHGQGVWTGQTIEVLSWIHRHEPAALAAAERVFVIKDYIKWRLTGAFAFDASEQSKLGLLDIAEPAATPRLLAQYGLESIAPKLAPVSGSCEVIGEISRDAAQATGLPAGVPVVNGLADIDASALGSGAAAAGQLSIVAGTWSINQFFLDSPLNRPGIFGTSRHAVPGVWEELEASASSTANLTWFVREACSDLDRDAKAAGRSVYDIVDEMVATVEPATTPVFFHPYLYGSNTHPNGRAGFYGLAGWQERRHLLAALFEGVVFSHAVHVQRLLPGGRKATDVCLSGGASRSAIWSQMFSDVLGLRLRVPQAREVGALGAAMCAAVGVKAHPNLPSAVRAMARAARTHEPRAVLGPAYAARFKAFQSITEQMRPVWNELESVFHSPAPSA